MPLPLYVPKETKEHEKRVALVPSVAAKLQKLGLEITMESGAGKAARIPDSAYTDAGVSLGSVEGAKLIFRVQPPSLEDIAQMPEGAVLCSFIYAQREPCLLYTSPSPRDS